jgi:hypothetical protein
MLLEVAANLGASRHIECRQRLIEQEKAWVGRECAGQRHSLALTARQRARLSFRIADQPHAIQPSGSLFGGLSLPTPAGSQAKRNVVQNAEVWEEEIVLEHDADRAQLGWDVTAGACVLENVSIQPYAPGCDRNQASDGSK